MATYTAWKEVWKLPVQAMTELIFPRVCQLCGICLEQEKTQYKQCISIHFCSDCTNQLLQLRQQGCSRCAATLPKGSACQDGCPFCQNEDFSFHSIHAWGAYEKSLQQMIVLMKQQENEQLSYYAGVILAEAFGDVLASRTVEAVVCVPLHWTRRLWRGYNQAETLARAVATRWNLPFYSHWLCRRRSTSRQATLTPTQRRKNLTLAMQASIPTKYRGRHVLLVDDVVTTGATVDACSKALLSAGARQVTVLALARATGTRIT